jgi:hypothetical protein
MATGAVTHDEILAKRRNDLEDSQAAAIAAGFTGRAEICQLA